MLLTILERTFKSGYPLPNGIRGSRGNFDKVGAMKIFLNVLKTGIIKRDVGLSDVGPRALTRGEERETIFVGELLFWLGQKSGNLPLVFKEGTVTRPTTGAMRVNAVEEKEDDEDDEDVFGKARDNTFS
jgi:hypothetical protein